MPFSLLAAAFLYAASVAQKPKSAMTRPYLHAPAINDYAKHAPSGTTILPEGKLLKPVGRAVPLAKWPHGLTLSPDAKTLFIPSEGTGQTVTGWDTAAPATQEFATGSDAGAKRPNSGGCAFSPDGKTLFWSGGDNGAVYLFDVATRSLANTRAVNGRTPTRSSSRSARTAATCTAPMSPTSGSP